MKLLGAEEARVVLVGGCERAEQVGEEAVARDGARPDALAERDPQLVQALAADDGLGGEVVVVEERAVLSALRSVA